MPVIANNVSLTAGSSSVNIFDNTNYQFVNEEKLKIKLATIGKGGKALKGQEPSDSNK